MSLDKRWTKARDIWHTTAESSFARIPGNSCHCQAEHVMNIDSEINSMHSPHCLDRQLITSLLTHIH
jgi:hypothetical protein